MGVTFDSEKQQFVFDFEHDGAADIVSLTGNGYQVEAFGQCFYYGYEFSDQVDGLCTLGFYQVCQVHTLITGTPRPDKLHPESGE